MEAVKELGNSRVEVGHFEEQGKHSSGYSYVELMKMHHYGHNPEGAQPFPERPLIDYFYFKNLELQDPRINQAILAWCKTSPTKESNIKLLDTIGGIMAAKEKELFGQSPPLAPNAESKGKNSPLVDSGELREKTAHRNSITNQIKEV